MLKHLLFPQRPLPPIDPQTDRPVSQAAGLWHHSYRYYRQAIQDALARPRRKPFQLGSLAGYDQRVGLLSHFENRRPRYGADPYLTALENRLRPAVAGAPAQAEPVRQAQRFWQQVEPYLAHTPRPTLTTQAKEARPPGQESGAVHPSQSRPNRYNSS